MKTTGKFTPDVRRWQTGALQRWLYRYLVRTRGGEWLVMESALVAVTKPHGQTMRYRGFKREEDSE